MAERGKSAERYGIDPEQWTNPSDSSNAATPHRTDVAPGFGAHGTGYGPQGGSQDGSFGAYGEHHRVSRDYMQSGASHAPASFDQPHGRVGFGRDASYGSAGEYTAYTDSIHARERDRPGQAGEEPGALAERHRADERAPVRPRGPKNYQRSDDRIKEDIYEKLMRDDRIDPHDVVVEVSAGVVTLLGSVAHRQMKHWIEDIAADCPGVKDVENKLRVAITATGPT